jgi:DNA-binding PadR family transcriptional regulator
VHTNSSDASKFNSAKPSSNATLNYGTLYQGLLKLEQQGYIASASGVSDNKLTCAGRKQREQAAAILAWFLSVKEQVAQSASPRTARSRTAKGATEETQDQRWALCSSLAPRTSNTSVPCEQNLKLL